MRKLFPYLGSLLLLLAFTGCRSWDKSSGVKGGDEKLGPDINAGGDVDGDGIVNLNDNCPVISNAGQEDQNENGIGDVCDEESVVGEGNENLVVNGDADVNRIANVDGDVDGEEDGDGNVDDGNGDVVIPGWSAVQQMSGDVDNIFCGPNVMTNDNGDSVLVWGDSEGVYVRRYSAAHNLWTDPERIHENVGDIVVHCLPFSDLLGNIFVVMHTWDEGLWVKQYNIAHGWDPAIIRMEEDPDSFVISLDIAGNRDGKVFVTWYALGLNTGIRKINVKRYDPSGGGWNVQKFTLSQPTQEVYFLDSLMTNSNELLFVWQSGNAEVGYRIDSKRYSWDLQSWLPQTIRTGLSFGNPWNSNLTLAKSTSGEPVLMWKEEGAVEKLFANHYFERMWRTNEEAASGGSLNMPFIAEDSSGNDLVAFFSFDKTYARRHVAGGDAWDNPLSEFEMTTLLDLGMDGSGNGILIGSRNQDIWLYRFSAGSGTWEEPQRFLEAGDLNRIRNFDLIMNPSGRVIAVWRSKTPENLWRVFLRHYQ